MGYKSFSEGFLLCFSGLFGFCRYYFWCPDCCRTPHTAPVPPHRVRALESPQVWAEAADFVEHSPRGNIIACSGLCRLGSGVPALSSFVWGTKTSLSDGSWCRRGPAVTRRISRPGRQGWRSAWLTALRCSLQLPGCCVCISSSHVIHHSGPSTPSSWLLMQR